MRKTALAYRARLIAPAAKTDLITVHRVNTTWSCTRTSAARLVHNSPMRQWTTIVKLAILHAKLAMALVKLSALLAAMDSTFTKVNYSLFFYCPHKFREIIVSKIIKNCIIFILQLVKEM